jgi:hypothetical protein
MAAKQKRIALMGFRSVGMVIWLKCLRTFSGVQPRVRLFCFVNPHLLCLLRSVKMQQNKQIDSVKR